VRDHRDDSGGMVEKMAAERFQEVPQRSRAQSERGREEVERAHEEHPVPMSRMKKRCA